MNIVKNEVFTSNIQTVGLLVDETQFRYSKELIKELVSNGIAEENIKIVAYRRKFKKKKIYSKPTFGRKHIDWRGQITEVFLSEFINTEFDLLISYYEVEISVLMMLTSKSKAKFKVGFSSVDKKLNRWMIETTTAEYKLFISEFFRYLKSIK
ncbi:hypothetical protein L1276_000814 [Flavobacterium sp. HSC-32F16]|nr:hypothetical protein [Flavobacterium sp. HSC-32F16]MCP2025674.1 hypothetical protein [Flavobacterium sp. HSC-32F16]